MLLAAGAALTLQKHVKHEKKGTIDPQGHPYSCLEDAPGRHTTTSPARLQQTGAATLATHLLI